MLYQIYLYEHHIGLMLYIETKQHGQIPSPPRQSQVTKGFLINTGMDLPLRGNLTLDPLPSRGRSLLPSVKYVDVKKKKLSGPPPLCMSNIL